MSRCIIPINEKYYLLFTMDFEENNFDKIIMEKIASLNKKKKENLLLIRKNKKSY
jgi:ribosomal protein S17E